MSPNRVVVLLSPVFVGLAGWLAAWIAQNFPGHPQLDKSGLAAVFIAGAVAAAAKVTLWLHNKAKWDWVTDHPPAKVPETLPKATAKARTRAAAKK